MWRRLSAESGFWNTICSARMSSVVRPLSVAGELPAVELDRAGRRRHEPEQRSRERGLAAARLADEAERLARPDRGRHADERVHVVALLLEHLAEVVERSNGSAARSTAGQRELGRHLARQRLRLLVEVAAAHVPATEVMHLRHLGPAALVGERAAAGEHAAGQLLPHVRHEAGNRVEPAVILADAAARHAAQQADRVRMARVGEHRRRPPLLDEPPGVEHADAVAHLPDDPEVVADEQHGGAELGLQAGHEVEHLGLDGRVEAGRRLVEDQQGRVGGERHRDHDALLHAARELMRIAAHHRVGVGDLDRASASRARSVASLRAAAPEDLGHLLADPDRGVEGGAGVLVDHRDRSSAAPSARSRQSPCVSAVDPDRPPETRPLRGR